MYVIWMSRDRLYALRRENTIVKMIWHEPALIEMW